MPHLIEIPSQLSPVIFQPGEHWLPTLPLSKRVLLQFWSLPIPCGRSILQHLIRRALDIPPTTQFISGFKCISGNLYLGQNVSVCDTFFVDYVPIYISDNVGFSYRNIVITSQHDLKTFDKVIAKPIVIERNVWVTTNVTILGGVRIGENSVIGAGSVVTRDIPANVFAAGNPCRPIKEITRGARN
ncbi:MAG TPA: acyltransferase [Phycisphaerae bacterium]|nr:acyltransferase [Phycisphaerae bacterium]